MYTMLHSHYSEKKMGALAMVLGLEASDISSKILLSFCNLSRTYKRNDLSRTIK